MNFYLKKEEKMIDSYHKKFSQFLENFSKLDLKEKEYLFSMIKNDLGNTNDSSIKCYRSYKSNKSIMNQFGVKVKDSNVLEIGSGKFSLLTGFLWLLSGVNKYFGTDKFCNPFDSEFWVNIYRNQVLNLELSDKDNKLKKIVTDLDWNQINEKIEVFKSDFIELNFGTNSMDYVYSNAVLEHVSEPEEVVKQLHRILKVGGVSYHGIDLRPHSGDRSTPKTILKYSPEEWNIIKPKKSYLNRLRSSDWEELFDKYNLKILSSNTHEFEFIDDSIYEEIAPEFRNHSLKSLRTRQLNIVVQKVN